MTKPTKVTKEDLELAAELNRITTIKTLLDQFSETLTSTFVELIDNALVANPVRTFIAIEDAQQYLEGQITRTQTSLLTVLGHVDEDEAHEIATATEEREDVPSDSETAEVVSTVVPDDDDQDEEPLEVV